MSDPGKFPTRRVCMDCGTRKGALRRACPYCFVPVCNGCWPMAHACVRPQGECSGHTDGGLCPAYTCPDTPSESDCHAEVSK